MKRLQALTPWLESRRELAYALIRFYLGIALFIRGLIFISDSSAIMELAQRSSIDWGLPTVLIHYVGFAHLAGGLMVAAGLLTRIGALIQIPVLLGAVFFVHIEDGLMAAGQSFELATLVLFLLVIFALFGSGAYSVDRYVARDEEGSYRAEAEVPA